MGCSVRLLRSEDVVDGALSPSLAADLVVLQHGSALLEALTTDERGGRERCS
jgi:hypothetical protein